MTDVIVIGGGIAGVSAGARLAAHGRVVLIEREPALGYHASGRSAALFEESYGLPSTQALNRASRAYHESAEVLSPRGFLLLGMPETAEAYDHDRAQMHLDEIGAEAARRMVPILSSQIDRAAYHTDALDIDTDRLIQHFARAIRVNGEIQTGAAVTAIERAGADWHVRAGDGEWRAPILVNAAGAWADGVAAMAGIAPLGLTPHRRSVARLAAPGGHDVRHWPLIFGPGETWYAKPDAGALIVSPADEDPSEPMDAFADDMVLAEGLDRYQAHVTEPVTRPLSTWAGLRTFAPDRQLVLGPDPAEPGFVWCAGQGGYGFQTAPAASQLVADRVAGRTPEIGAEAARALDPARLR